MKKTKHYAAILLAIIFTISILLTNCTMARTNESTQSLANSNSTSDSKDKPKSKLAELLSPSSAEPQTKLINGEICTNHPKVRQEF